MTLIRRELPLPPDPLRLARRLDDEPQLALLWSASQGGPSYLGVRPIDHVRGLDPEPTLAARVGPGAGVEPPAPRWIGLLPYEACRQIERPGRVAQPDSRPPPHALDAEWWRFGAMARVDERVTVVGDDPASVRYLVARLLTSPDREPQPTSLDVIRREPEAQHAERIERALALIRRGEIYQVSLAHRTDLCVHGTPVDLLMRLCRHTRPSHAAALRLGPMLTISTSPELFLRQSAGNHLLTRPIKGTRPRGRDAREDELLARQLEADPKERAELSMIVDVERNDLGRVCRPGSVRLVAPPRVTSQGLVWHRAASVVGRLRAGVDRESLLRAMLPSGSVTGAPKIRAMEVIAQLESARRGLYTGALGFLGHAGELCLAMAIRTLTVRGNEGHYFAGGGIVADSVAAREVEETHWKSRQLFGRSGAVATRDRPPTHTANPAEKLSNCGAPARH